MRNLVSWFEIPVLNFSRAMEFYSSVFNLTVTESEIHGFKMGFFPWEGVNCSGALVLGEGYVPSTSGVTIYFDCGDDLQPTLDRIAPNGGTVAMPKTLISEDVGYMAFFLDTEGNRIALHSKG